MSQLDSVAQQGAASSEELAATSEELNAQAAEVDATIGFFKLSEHDKRNHRVTQI